jgi:hypothetical protein
MNNRLIQVGDLVRWNLLTIDTNDLPEVFLKIKAGERLEEIITSSFTILEEHTGMVQSIKGMDVEVIDFTGRKEFTIPLEDAHIKFTILNQ